ncbi:MAG: HIT domain-containing protein [Chloroflexota bacterium]
MNDYVYHAADANGRKRDWYCLDVLTGQAPIERIYEDELVLAFHHPRPEAPVHAVIIPKTHTPSLLGPEALDSVLLVAMVNAVQEVARRLKIGREGLTLIANAGAPGVTPHMHWHVRSPL